MRKIFVIGIGAGDPDHVTVQAINRLNEIDVFFVLDKGREKEDLLRLRYDILERYVEKPSYRLVTARDRIAIGRRRTTRPRSRTGIGSGPMFTSVSSGTNSVRSSAAASWSGATRHSTTARSPSSTPCWRAGTWRSTTR